MKRSELPAKSNRTFSKRMVCINSALAWCVMFYAVYTQQASAVAISAFGFIATLGAGYMGVGAFDMRQLLTALAPSGDYSTPLDPMSDDHSTEER